MITEHYRQAVNRIRMDIFSILVILIICYNNAHCQYPGKEWLQYKLPDEAGWSADSLRNVMECCKQWNVGAMMVIYKGNLLLSYGDISRRFDCHSIRKSLLNSLYGVYTEKGIISLDKTMEDLNIDDRTILTHQEKLATIEDLLKSRSGIYIPAVGETESMKNERPQRGSHLPGTFFYYNNWDFNVLGTIFRNVTQRDLFGEFYDQIAVQIQMEDFRLLDGTYYSDSTLSIHSQYAFKMSARDLARFGLLYLNKGKWKAERIISPEWVSRTTMPYYNGSYWGYGYLWWTCNHIDSTIFEASGSGGQKVIVIPKSDMVIVILNNTYKQPEKHRDIEFIKLLQNAQVAQPRKEPKLIPVQVEPDSLLRQGIDLEPGELQKYAQVFDYKKEEHRIQYTPAGLIYDNWYRLLPLSKTVFYAEDIEQFIIFQFDSIGKPHVIELKFTDE